MSSATGPDADDAPGAEDAERSIRADIGRGNFLRAHDRARRAVAEHPDDLRLRYLLVLALARSGATDRARAEIAAMSDLRPADIPPDLAEDLGAIGARLAKDEALAATGARRRRRAAEAAAAYEDTYRDLQRPFACVNAATMWLLADQPERSAELARATLQLCAPDGVDAGAAAIVDDYWRRATRAEALLLLGDAGGCDEALRAAVTAGPDRTAVAATRRQLLLICDLLDIDAAAVDALSVQDVVHYCGHMLDRSPDGRFPPSAEPAVAATVDALLEEWQVGSGHGSLAGGADIVVAEALLRRGADLHVVLPFGVEEFRRTSVEPSGPDWVERFDRCLAAATDVVHATSGAYLGDDDLFGHCSAIAMGRALVSARTLSANVRQVAVWDGEPGPATAGTAADVARWHRSGHSGVRVPPDGGPPRPVDPAPAADAGDDSAARQVRALLFGDVQGFSRLDDRQILRFVDTVLSAVAGTLDGFGADVLHRNSWGDGIYVVLRSVSAGADCALALQEAFRSVDLVGAGLPALGLRIGMHAGPVTGAPDPVQGEPGYFGVEVTRTARIEPTTPPGDVYVTDVFAALLELESAGGFRCEYVGRIDTAKNYGEFPMYVLKRTV